MTKFYIKILTLLIIITMFAGITCSASVNYFYDGKWNIHDTKNISLYLDGKKINFDVPPIIISGRTMVPVRAVFEQAGAKVSWDGDKRQVTVKNDKYKVVLTIDSNIGMFGSTPYKMDVPAKIITDTSGVARTMIPVRFIAELLGYTVDWDADKYVISIYTDNIQNNTGDISTDDPASITEPPKDNSKITKITNRIADGKDVIEIYSSDTSVRPDAALLSSPDRLMFNFPAANLTIHDGETGKSGIFISNVRYAYHLDNNYTRVVLDLNSKVDYKITTTDSVYTITLTGTVLNDIDYKSSSNQIVFNDGLISKKSYNDSTFVYIFTSTSGKLGEGVIAADDTYIKSISIKKVSGGSEITINAKTGLSFEIENSYDSSAIKFKRISVNTASNVSANNQAKSRLVVIDAGHGGTDPGAIGKDGNKIDLKEKDVTLDVSLMINDILKNSGVNVVLTRNKDVYVELNERARIANSKNAALFVSVHVNSFTSPDANGTMVYYYAGGDEDKSSESVNKNVVTGKTLAKNIQDSLMSNINTEDRGLGDGSRFLVIRETLMPSVIVETAFISNPSDKALLKKSSFRKQLAQSIADGIIKTLNQMK